MTRLRWFAVGALITAFGISGSSLVLEGSRRKAEAARVEHERVERENAELTRRNAELAEQRRKLEEVVGRLNIERRVASIEVMQQHVDEATGKIMQTVIRFAELGRDGKMLVPQVFGVSGDTPHFDALVLKFGKDFVAEGDALRGQSLALFRRVYGDSDAPDKGYWIGRPGDVPDVYRVNPKPSEFELRLWQSFWAYARDPEKARGAGVRVAQGEAVYAPMRANDRWTLTLEANGGLNLIRDDGTESTAPTLARPGPAANPDAPSPEAAGERQKLSAPPPADHESS